ncbi:hypothetical protein FA13DRAFT_514070 [Coprinellus micaceus]|uniref:Uncharacterized protein n=1 Tax=Coprinellus micaceus TaxID=71717 RepID=A0A4Y7SC25_COPMI|nr:hypothetical protein FA13DRAFT_514070 [Coprinellus micaceus]
MTLRILLPSLDALNATLLGYLPGNSFVMGIRSELLRLNAHLTIIVPDHTRSDGVWCARGDENRLEEVRADNKPAEATNSLIINQRKHLEIMINRQRIPRGEVRPHFTMAKGWA